VTQSSAGKPEAAEERTEQTRTFVRRVRSATQGKCLNSILVIHLPAQ
jgi:hypothetical protein